MKMKKTLVLILALVLIASLTIGGTLAYFAIQSETATNTFEISSKNIDIDNPDDDNDGEPDLEFDWDPDDKHPIIPDATYAKDPQISLLATNPVDVWVIFRVEEVNNYVSGKQIVEWDPNTELSDVTDDMKAVVAADADNDDVYYYAIKVNKETAKKVTLFTTNTAVSNDGSVHINASLTDDDLAAITDDVDLVINAWVIQASAGDTAAAAYDAVY